MSSRKQKQKQKKPLNKFEYKHSVKIDINYTLCVSLWKLPDRPALCYF